MADAEAGLGGRRDARRRLEAFVGLEIPIAGKSTLELGYINQTVDTPGPGTAMSHIVSVSVAFRP